MGSRDLGPLNRLQGLPVPDFTSAETAITVDSVHTVAHGLGALPNLYTVHIRCNSAELGFAVDDEILVSSLNADAADKGLTVYVNDTNVLIVVGNAISVIRDDSFDSGGLTVASWVIVVRAWK